jgi:hypothetical protein
MFKKILALCSAGAAFALTAIPASAWFGPFGFGFRPFGLGFGFGFPFFGFGFPFGFSSSFMSSFAFSSMFGGFGGFGGFW